MHVAWEDRRKRRADRRKSERIWRQRYRDAGIHQQVVAFLFGAAFAWVVAGLIQQDAPAAGGAREERTPPPGLPEETRPAPSGPTILTSA